MTSPLRSDELTSCLHRIALSRGAPVEIRRATPSTEMQYRQHLALVHRDRVLNELGATYEASRPGNVDATMAALADGVQVILNPQLPEIGGRRARVQVLWRLGRHNDRFLYAPLLIKNNEVGEPATTRHMLEATLRQLAPGEAVRRNGIGPRGTATVTRNGLALAHATRLLHDLGVGDPRGRVAMIDRNDAVWWFELADESTPRFNLAQYDVAYQERRDVLDGHERWRAGAGPYPTTPYYHRECEECLFRPHCSAELEATDDVSLVHYTTLEQQALLRAAGVATRHDLAALEPALITSTPSDDETQGTVERTVGRSIERLAELIYRARVTTWGTFLQTGSPDTTNCPVADVEVDVDMESYNDRTYLWGATVRTAPGVTGFSEGYHAFVTWDDLTDEREAEVFAQFWRWFDAVRRATIEQGRTFAAYCFWAQAENGAMDRAVATNLVGGPDADEVRAFRSLLPAQWVDLHEHAKRCIQTDGPLGLKHLARAAGFAWRDENPSGEASMLWYEGAVGGGDDAAALRTRILEYNEDDCRATQALRDWLNGAAKMLPHRDGPISDGTSVG